MNTAKRIIGTTLVILTLLVIITGVILMSDTPKQTEQDVPVNIITWDIMNDEQRHEAIKNGTAVLDTDIENAIKSGAIVIDK